MTCATPFNFQDLDLTANSRQQQVEGQFGRNGEEP